MFCSARRLSMIFSENRYPPPITSGAGFFGIMLYERNANFIIEPGASSQMSKIRVLRLRDGQSFCRINLDQPLIRVTRRAD
jgi:hypothetical protein